MNKKKYAALISMLVGILLFTVFFSGSQLIDKSTVALADVSQYTVQKGDSLYLIARQKDVSVAQLKQVNGLSSDVIYVGQLLKIPYKDQSIVNYTVQKGDSLYVIANQYGTTINNLKQINGLSSDVIYVGQVLAIPSGKNAANSYTVQKGDSLYSIAIRYGTTVNYLKKVNELTSNVIYIGEKLIIPSGNFNSNTLQGVLKSKGILKPDLKIIIDKSDHTLSLFSGNTWLKTYHTDFGDGGPGDKNVAGDHKTPEGTFYVTQKSVLTPADKYLGTRWMRLSYPNIEDASRGLNQGMIDKNTYNEIVNAINNGQTPPQHTALGGGIGIHGGTVDEFKGDWTWGCIGLTNKDVEDFYSYVKVGTPVIINK